MWRLEDLTFQNHQAPAWQVLYLGKPIVLPIECNPFQNSCFLNTN
ncbi:hypothetical protein OSCI_3200005 [Kamptonema sp. PCC 6506]|nr:hypothetical protein OSCI_3200005 [Kamptonema sp. PCC 6506]